MFVHHCHLDRSFLFRKGRESAVETLCWLRHTEPLETYNVLGETPRRVFGHTPSPAHSARHRKQLRGSCSPAGLEALPAEHRPALRRTEWHRRLLPAPRARGLRFYLVIAIVLPGNGRRSQH